MRSYKLPRRNKKMEQTHTFSGGSEPTKKSVWLVGFVVLFLIIGGYVIFYDSTDADEVQVSGDLQKVVIAEASQPVFALIYIAETQGYFAREGLKVEYKKFTSGRDALNSVISGEADLATVFETPIVLQTFAGEELSAVTGLHASQKNTALVARVDRGITEMGDLRGKKVGVTKNTNGEFFLSSLLTVNGIGLDEVEFVDTKPGDMASSLKKGEIDAAATWNPNLFTVRRSFDEGQIVVIFSEDYTEFSVLAGKRKFVEQNPEIIKKVLRALLKSEEFLAENDRDSQEIAIDWLSELSPNTIRAIWFDAEKSIQLSNEMVRVLEEEAKWFSSAGIVAGEVPDFYPVIYSLYLEELKPGAVNLV